MIPCVPRLRTPFFATAVLAATAAAQPSISITGVPAFGSPGGLFGSVSGVNPATHAVAVYIYIDGAGWWSKPGGANPNIPIQANGTFSTNVVTGGVDAFATIYCAALLGPGVIAPLAAGSGQVPASLQSLALTYRTRTGRTVDFAGRTWHVKQANLPVGPGGNLFSSQPGDVWVDAQGRLHLTVRRTRSGWTCTEVVLQESLGYGTYWFTTESEVEDLDHFLTFGAFTWDPYGDDTTIPEWPYREIDFEDSRWGNPASLTNSQCVVQPFTNAGALSRYVTPDLAGAPTLTRFFTWEPSQIEFAVARGRHAPYSIPAGSEVHRWTFRHQPLRFLSVPPAGREQFRFNLWINGGGGPSNGQTAEVIISDFRFAPVGAFPGGCGINPDGSMQLAAGTPQPGAALTFAIDNPTGSQTAGAQPFLAVGGQPTPAFPCGVAVQGLGMQGPAGELLLSLAPPPAIVAGTTPFGGPGNPASAVLAIPNSPALTGAVFYVQGLLLDGQPSATQPIGLANALQLQLR